MGCLSTVREFVDDLESVVQLPTMVSSSCEWKSKDLAVTQSHKASSWRRECQSSFFQCPYIGLQQKVWPRLKMCATTPGFGTWFVPGWPWTQEISLPQSPGLKVCTTLPGPKLFMATMPQDLHAKIQVRNLCLPASRSGSQVSPPILDFGSFQI